MRDELFRILQKDGWEREDVEELSVIFEDESILDLSPDVLETALKLLFKGRGSLKKRLKTASLMTGIEAKRLEKFLSLKRKEKAEEVTIEFQEILERLKGLDHRCLKQSDIEDAELAYELSEFFKENFLSDSSIHPYIKRVVSSKRRIPLIVDGNNLLWRNDLSVSALDDFFSYLVDTNPVFFPVRIIFDRNVRYIVPVSEREELERWISLPCVHLHSPADELIISLAKGMKAYVASSDRFSEYDTDGIVVVDFSKFNL